MEEMSEREARQRLVEGGYFVALGVPVGVEFGVDLKSYKTGPQFKGVKMIPAGIHLAHYGTGEGEKQGFFFRSGANAVAATQWDTSAEDLVNAEACLPEGALRALRDSVLRLELDASLGPYPFEQRAAWVNLTNSITDSVLERCSVPIGAKVMAGSSAAEPGEPGRERVNGGGFEETKGEGVTAEVFSQRGVGMELMPHFPHVGRVARFCELPERIGTGWRLPPVAEGDTAESMRVDPTEITKRNMDGSAALGELIRAKFGGSWKELLGELQLSFVLFVSLSSLRGFRHWQALSALLCQCADALATTPPLFTTFIRMLHAHLKLVPEDFFDVELSKDNFLVPCLSALLQNVIPDEALSPALVDAAKRLFKFLQRRFGLFPGNLAEKSAIEGSAGKPRSGPITSSSASAAANQSGDSDNQYMDEDFDSGSEVFVPGEGMMDVGQDTGRRQGGWGGGEEAAGRGAGVSLEEEISLMQLELCEEDQPAVVPYEEVARVLGGDALNGLPIQSVSPSTQTCASTGTVGITKFSTASKAAQNTHGPVALSTPSTDHAQRWQDIDRLLSAASPNRGSNHCVPGFQHRHPPANSTVTLPSPTADRIPRADWSRGYAASAANRYPLLFASVAPNEDVMMAAARLVSPEDEDEGGGVGLERRGGVEEEMGRGEPSLDVVEQAITFLQEVEGRDDGGATAWLSSIPLRTDQNVAGAVDHDRGQERLQSVAPLD